MALTKVTGHVVKTDTNVHTHNINSSGIVTSIGLDVNGNADISGNLGVGGTLTYQDVTSIDAVGIITAQSGIYIGAGATVGSFNTTTGISSFKKLNVDETSTLNGSVGIADSIIHIGNTDTSIRFPSNDNISMEIAGTTEFELSSTRLKIGGSIRAGDYVAHRTVDSLGVKFLNAGTGNNNTRIGLGAEDNGVSTNHQTFLVYRQGSAVNRVNIDNSGNLNIVSGSLTIPDSIIHTGDTNTKIRFPAADQFSVETGGSQRLLVQDTGAKVTGTLELTDSLYWDGDTNTTIDNAGGTADFIRFKTGGTTVMDINASQNILIHDDRQLIIGGGSDLKLYHSSSNNNSYVTSTTNNVIHAFNVAKEWTVQTTAGDKRIHFPTTKSVELYHNGTKKFETDKHGTITTGIATVTNHLRVTGSQNSQLTNNQLIFDRAGTSYVDNNNNSGSLSFRVSASNTVGLHIDSNADVHIPSKLIHSGDTDTFMEFTGNNIHFDTAGTERLVISSGGAVQVNGGAVHLDANGELAVFETDTNLAFTNSAKLAFDFSGNVARIRTSINGSASIRPLAFYTGNDERLRIDSHGCVRVGNTATQTTSGNTKRIALGAKGSIQGWVSGQLNGHIQLTDNYYWDGANNKAIEADHCAFLSLRSGSLRFGTTNSTQTAGQNVSGGIHERFRITSDGKVGIGEDDPESNHLLIRGASTVGTKSGHIMLTGDGATNGEGPQIVFSESGSGSSYAGGYVGFVRQGGNSVGHLVFGTRNAQGDANTAPTERLRITSAGLVGIGTDNPSEMLQVGDGSGTTGGLKVAGQSSSVTDDGLTIDWTSSNEARLFSESSGDSTMKFYTTSSGTRGLRHFINSNGNTDIYANQVHLYNSVDTSNTYFYAQNTGAGNAGIKMKNNQGEWTIIANDRLRFIDDDAGVERFNITSDGKVGINYAATPPSEDLMVRGAGSTGAITIQHLSGGNSYGARMITRGSTNTGFKIGTQFNSSYNERIEMNGNGQVVISPSGDTNQSTAWPLNLTQAGNHNGTYPGLCIKSTSTGGGSGFSMVAFDSNWGLYTNSGNRNGLAILDGTSASSSNAKLVIGTDGVTTIGKDAYSYTHTSRYCGAALHVVKGSLSIGGNGSGTAAHRGGVYVLGWYITQHANASYYHLKTDLWAGGSPHGNNEYIMGGFRIEGYSYSSPTGSSTAWIQFHNWNGSYPGLSVKQHYHNWDMGATVYTSSDGYVVLRVNGGTYKGHVIDLIQHTNYSSRDINVSSAAYNNNATHF